MPDQRTRPAMAIHGGAGARRGRDYGPQLRHLSELVRLGRDRLEAGAPALEVVVEVVEALEASGLYVAGRGAGPNSVGRYELDAAVMDGQGRRAGAVAGLQGFRSPVRAARRVLDADQVLLAGEGAAAFAAAQGLEPVGDEAAWFVGAGGAGHAVRPSPRQVGTVGCVARDGRGRLAAATSTGGLLGKPQGRVGDAPLVGAGTWADERVAVSCTGYGEAFIRAAAAAQLAFRLRFGGEAPAPAARAVLDDVASLGGDGGLIAVSADGEVIAPFNSQGMTRALLHPDGRVAVEAF